MNIIESYLVNNPCYKAGKKITVKGIMLHSIGCPQPSASVFVKNWNKASYNTACVHAFIDANNGTIYKCLPWNHRGWHAGGAANNTHIGVEMCEPACIKYTIGSSFACSNKAAARAAVKKTYDSAVKLFAMLCKQYRLDPLADGVIISHKEGHARGIASNHGDPEHLWKGLGMGYTMNGFRKAVKAAMNTSNETAPVNNSDYPAVPFEVEVIIDNLNYRSEPSMNGKVKGKTGKGIFTITQVSNDWGKLKSGAGWIWLKNDSYCTIRGSIAESKGNFAAYKVKVTVSDLNIRKGAGTNYAKTGMITDKGIYTIVAESEGQGASKWGKLKSGEGWISLDYVKKV